MSLPFPCLSNAWQGPCLQRIYDGCLVAACISAMNALVSAIILELFQPIFFPVCARMPAGVRTLLVLVSARLLHLCFACHEPTCLLVICLTDCPAAARPTSPPPLHKFWVRCLHKFCAPSLHPPSSSRSWVIRILCHSRLILPASAVHPLCSSYASFAAPALSRGPMHVR